MKDEFACGMRSLTPEESEELKNIYKSLSDKVDFAPVVHAKWEELINGSYLDPRMVCSNCGNVSTPLVSWKCCPICGAKMDKE